MRISDWSSDVCSSDLDPPLNGRLDLFDFRQICSGTPARRPATLSTSCARILVVRPPITSLIVMASTSRSEEHTSELQSLMRISYAVFCLKKKIKKKMQHTR